MLMRVTRMYENKRPLRLEGMPVTQICLEKVMESATADVCRRDAQINVSRREQ